MSKLLRQPAHNPPTTRPKADLRREATAWQVLQWAYHNECARAHGGETRNMTWCSNAFSVFLAKDNAGGSSSGGTMDCHIDALTIDAFVRARLKREALHQVWKAAEARELPAWRRVDIERLRAVPHYRMRKGRKVIKVEYNSKGKPHRCNVDFVGYGEAERQEMQRRQKEIWKSFVALLQAMVEANVAETLELERWKLTGIGVEAEPWTSGQSLTS